MTTYNLDDQVSEFFEFTVLGHNYRFKHLNTEEMTNLQKNLKEEDELQKFFANFVTPIGDAPPFAEISKKMLPGHWKQFRNMITTEMGDGGNTGQ